MPPLPTLFIPHGGGPLPLLGAPCHAAMAAALAGLPRRLPERPRAVLLVSAHWEEKQPQLTSSPDPGLLFDYYGFPPESYTLKYPAPGSPQLAERAAALLRGAGFKPSLNPGRALDHGAFVPLTLMWPEADIPVVQLSLKSSLDPEEHYLMGRALAPLRDEGVLLLGSGMTFHGMSDLREGMGRPPTPGRDPGTLVGQDFNRWVGEACAHPPSRRRQLLAQWQAAPGARRAHPREEHLIPLMVVMGAADGASGSAGHVVWDGEVMGAAVSAVAFGGIVGSS